MKTKHLPLSVALALGVTFVPAFSTRAATVIFTYDGTIDTWVVPDTGVYDITAFGAEGGYGLAYGGLGAEIRGSLALTAGTVLSILVGGMGVPGRFEGVGSGGGGASSSDPATRR